MKTSQLRRLEALEAARPARPDMLTDYVLERMTDDELAELMDLFGDRPSVEDLPREAQARVRAVLEAASKRPDPAPWPSSSAAYVAWAERVRSENPATAGPPDD